MLRNAIKTTMALHSEMLVLTAPDKMSLVQDVLDAIEFPTSSLPSFRMLQAHHLRIPKEDPEQFQYGQAVGSPVTHGH